MDERIYALIEGKAPPPSRHYLRRTELLSAVLEHSTVDLRRRGGSPARRTPTAAEASAVEATAVVEARGGSAAEAAATDPTPIEIG